jgi:hypothetical protein
VNEPRVPDPLTSFIGRSLRADVSDVSEEILQDTTEAEVDRVRFTQDGERRSLIVKRVPPHSSLEVKLLPHLARKTDRVPAVHARGIPPATAAGWPWLLIEDLQDAPSGADDPEGIVRAKAAIERAVSADAPALIALGVPRIARRGPLAEWPEVLVHGALSGANAVRTERGVVLLEWRHASLGCGLTDIARLSRSLAVAIRPLAELYAAESGSTLTAGALEAAAELL